MMGCQQTGSLYVTTHDPRFGDDTFWIISQLMQTYRRVRTIVINVNDSRGTAYETNLHKLIIAKNIEIL